MIRRLWRWLLARFRLDLQVVCEESAGMGPCDYHDGPDDKLGFFLCHMVDLQCMRCGKMFRV